MRKVFWDNPYQTHLETRVVSVDTNRVLFEETIAFSFSGGQESDTAYINGLTVIHSEIQDNLIYYTLSEVGYITLKRINVGGGKERIEIKMLENNFR